MSRIKIYESSPYFSLSVFSKYPQMGIAHRLMDYLSSFRNCDVELLDSISGIEVGQEWHRKKDMRYEEKYRHKRKVIDIYEVSDQNRTAIVIVYELMLPLDVEWGNTTNPRSLSRIESFKSWGKLQENLTSRS